MKKITQTELKEYRKMEEELDELQFVFGEVRAGLMTRIDKGAKVEKGVRTATLKSVERRSVSWRMVVLRLKGERYINRVLAGTKAKFFFKLTVR